MLVVYGRKEIILVDSLRTANADDSSFFIALPISQKIINSS